MKNINSQKHVNQTILSALEEKHAESALKVANPKTKDNSTSQNHAKARFGLAVILCSLLAMIGGLYLTPDDVYGRGFLLFTGIFVFIYGAMVFDKANKSAQDS